MKDHTRVDLFRNVDDVIAFYEWAATKNPKTKEDMVKLLAEYKRPDIVIADFKEHVEHKLTEELNVHKEIKNG
jgi:precorrin-3B methylase